MEFEVNKERGYIELYNLLKNLGLSASGGEAKHFIRDKEVYVNNAVETRCACKIRPGDKVEFQKQTINVI
jgi:ribosome-associated protein